MARLFTSFDEAWESFLEREDPLESLWSTLPTDEAATVDVWLLLPDDEIRDAAAHVQRMFDHLDWIAPVPRHFLHVTVVDSGESVDPGYWRDAEPFDLDLRAVTSFHDAVVVEARGDGTRRLRERAGLSLSHHLPHLTLGYFRSAGDPAPLRRILTPMRSFELGQLSAHQVVQCRVPIAQSTFLTPWLVLDSVPLAARR